MRPVKDLSRLVRSRRGNIAIMTALLLPLAIVFAGSAIDLSNRARVRTAVQEAADAGALAAAYAYVHRDDVELRAGQAAHRVFMQNVVRKDLVRGFKRSLKRKGNEWTYSVDADMATSLLGIIGVNTLSVDASATAVVPQANGMEVALIIDITHSMDFGNSWSVAIDTLSDVLDHLRTHANPNHFYVSLVPFSDRVNVGNADWLSGAEPAGWNGCFEPREESVSGFPFALTDRPPDTDQFDASIPGVTGGLSDYRAGRPACPSTSITGPTHDVETVANAAKSLTRTGTGRPDVGLAWGWRLMSRNWVNRWDISGYPGVKSKTKKVAVFISDGHTVAYEWEMSKTVDWGNNNGSREGFEHMERVCDEMKKDGIEIFVFRINGNAHADPYFEGCATSPSHYRLVTNNEDIENAFSLLIDEDDTIRLVR